MINQGVARAFARVRRPGVLTFAVVSEVGVSGRRVDGGHSLNSQNYWLVRVTGRERDSSTHTQ